jgi:L-alanine-DL-glutamate epimerase-like enolase superfamily enzyme
LGDSLTEDHGTLAPSCERGAPWTNLFFKETPKITHGGIEVPARPGLSLELDEKACASEWQ